MLSAVVRNGGDGDPLARATLTALLLAGTGVAVVDLLPHLSASPAIVVSRPRALTLTQETSAPLPLLTIEPLRVASPTRNPAMSPAAETTNIELEEQRNNLRARRGGKSGRHRRRHHHHHHHHSEAMVRLEGEAGLTLAPLTRSSNSSSSGHFAAPDAAVSSTMPTTSIESVANLSLSRGEGPDPRLFTSSIHTEERPWERELAATLTRSADTRIVDTPADSIAPSTPLSVLINAPQAKPDHALRAAVAPAHAVRGSTSASGPELGGVVQAEERTGRATISGITQTEDGIRFEVTALVNGRPSGRMTVLICGADEGHPDEAVSEMALRLGDVIDLLQPRIDPATYLEMSSSKHANEYLTFATMRERGISVSFDRHDRLVLQAT